MKLFTSLVLALGLWAVLPASAADREGVAVSIKPLHSLVSAVMQGVATPQLIVAGAGSEHSYSLKPSDARTLQNAKLIFWAGPSMETFLERPLESLGADAKIIALSESPGLKRLKMREGGAFELHDHAADPHDHADEADGHVHTTTEGEAHDHDEYDLHFWLDPDNGIVLVRNIAAILAESDPANAEKYKANAENYVQRLQTLTAKISSELQPVQNKPFIVFHDAYQYFEHRFDLQAAGSITVSPEKAPGAARLQAIRDKIKSLGATCVFSEPQFESKLVRSVLDGTEAKTGVLDPLGAELADGPDLYPQLIENLALSLKNCLQ